jgi:hypothetical protein
MRRAESVVPPVRRAVTVEALVVIHSGMFAPAGVGVFGALRRDGRVVIWIR